MEENEPETPTTSAEDRAKAMERWEKLASRTGNPVYTWMALGYELEAVLSSEPPDQTCSVTLPRWIAEYLLQTSEHLMHLARGVDWRKIPRTPRPDIFPEIEAWIKPARVDSKRAMSLVATALGLTREEQRWNAFSTFIEKTLRMHEFQFYNDVYAGGATSEEAFRRLAKVLNVSERQAQKRVQEGRRLAVEE